MQRVVLSWTSALRSIPQDQACSNAPCTTGGAVVSGKMVGWLVQQNYSQPPLPAHALAGMHTRGRRRSLDHPALLVLRLGHDVCCAEDGAGGHLQRPRRRGSLTQIHPVGMCTCQHWGSAKAGSPRCLPMVATACALKSWAPRRVQCASPCAPYAFIEEPSGRLHILTRASFMAAITSSDVWLPTHASIT